MNLGLYIHIPFCLSKCIYCDFYSLPRGRWQQERYEEALLSHLRAGAELCRDYRVDTVYLGGGTPTCLGAEKLSAILRTVVENYNVDLSGELTFEANPESAWDVSQLAKLREAGFNRVSLGVQSADDAMLKRLGRPHTFAQAQRAVSAIRQAGFENLSLDLIYGLPGQDMARWQDTLERVTALEPEHMSCYGLQVEEGTPLWKMREKLTIPDDDQQADMYLFCVDFLAKQGYAQYEISNFARPGRYSRHNARYWQLSPYLGFGPGAHSDFGGERFACVRDLDTYCRGAENHAHFTEQRQKITLEEREREYILLGLRTVHGICGEEYRAIRGRDFSPAARTLERFIPTGHAVLEEGRYHLTPTGFLISNYIIEETLEAME